MEKVQLSLERFLPELRDLERKNVFSKDEIADIVSKRRGFEVALSKRDVKPVDYLRYIEYEVRLEKLRKSRAARLQTTTKKTLSDHSIAAHITHLHRLSTRRFPASLPLWDAFLSHSLTLASPLLVSRTLSSAIAMHPSHVAYWLMASRWESEGDRKGMGGGNTEGARRLCMRALRFLKGASGEDEVWKEWVRVEVAFVERVRGRWTVLGIGKKVEEEKKEEQMDLDEEEGAAEVEVPLMEGEAKDVETDDRAKEVQEQVLSGQEAILDGAIVRVVLDNCLASYSHSLVAHQLLIDLLRTLPSPLRLPLLSHVYASLSSHFPSSSPSFADAVILLATRPLYDVAYNPKHKELDSEGGFRVEGEALVDAVGEVVDEFWKACKGKKGKGKAKEKADVKVWEAFCSWLEATEDEVEDENLTVFLTTNLTTALSLSPSSPSISLLHLRHLLRTTAPHSTILAFAKSITPPSSSSSSPAELSTAESLWVARLETVVALAAPDAITSTFSLATSSLPFSGRIWDVHAAWIERTGAEDVSAWYEASIRRVLRADAVPPVGFESQFEGLEPRELLPRRYLGYLATKGDDIQSKVESLLRSAPALSIDFLSFALSLAGPGVSGSVEARFREMMHSRIIEHAEAGAEEWVAFAEELLRMGEVVKSNEVVRRAMRTLKGGELAALERRWTEVCDA